MLLSTNGISAGLIYSWDFSRIPDTSKLQTILSTGVPIANAYLTYITLSMTVPRVEDTLSKAENHQNVISTLDYYIVEQGKR